MINNFNHHKNIIYVEITIYRINFNRYVGNRMRSAYSLFTHSISRLATLLFIGVFSHMAYSADPILCTPTNGIVPSVHIHQNFTATPAGSVAGIGYSYPSPIIAAGPITCDAYKADYYTVMASSPTGGTGTMGVRTPIQYGFNIGINIGQTPGYATNNFSWALTGNSPNIPNPMYAQIVVYPPKSIMNTTDIVIDNDMLIGYIEVTGRTMDDTYVPTNKTNMTAVYYSGTIHIPPYCYFYAGNNSDGINSYYTMPAHFGSDFSAVSAGSPVGEVMSIGGHASCQGGSSAGDGDLVHISIQSSRVTDNPYIAGTSNSEIGFQVLDASGTALRVDGSIVATVATQSAPIGETHVGVFDYPLKLQLMSVHGIAPVMGTKNYTGLLTIRFSMD
ncbi:hypothetical protein [Hafnia alvei]|uniref:hypothetical protein n=1 Tax=Hafnia alvei TaxID=569 RepID=UPI0010337A9A|nr:hypothetical protein [Hafnia alvei]TBL92927.1 hypothetical protein EYY90_15230 [Hafnia alvei]